ncbi:DNA topoisomerase VI subunit B [Halonotius roseus]|uniref:Type 2 DNA topoisomerase 6 subunit B n=1 Tax=Halonotius roseus TaxID=2511997 RepID=A0A544QPX9_9EURY|nr:DNA topoisomerase VI subunit B [Halonotius roseus]TQQ81504.1 DNA topoisomerase VI subunit B [Halonotius roseus]
MTSFQAELGADEGIAEELAKGQREISIAEFFEKNKHMLGFDSGARGLVTAVKEAVDNALDATEEAGIRPDIYVEITEVGDYYRVVVEDNGPGITKDQVPKIFGKLLYGSRFHAREQNRGQQGIGISAAVLYSQLTSGKPAKITSRTKEADQAEYFELIIDTDTNEPEIRDSEPTTWDRTHGTRIELEMEANMRARQQLHQYIKNTAVVNPHARIELREPGLEEPLKFERGTDQLPAETSEIRPHPHGVELGTLIKMIAATESYSVSGFLQEEFTRVGKKTADKVLDSFRDRHFGRELAWPTPATGIDIAGAVTDAVSNKGAEATETFATEIEAELRGRDRTAHSELAAIVDEIADEIEADTGRTFGATVREHAVDAAWGELTVFESDDATNGEEPGRDHLTPGLYGLVDDATSSRKDDETVQALAERLARRADGLGDDGDRRFRVTHDELSAMVEAAADATVEYDDVTLGETAREKITDALWSAAQTVPDEVPKISEIEGDRDTASELLEAMRATDILSPPTDCLSPITADLVEAGLRKEYDADFFAAATRDAEVHGGDPFIVEAGIAYGGDLQSEGKIDLLRFANRVPLVYQQGACSSTDVVKGIGWRNYGLDQPGGSGLPNGPAVLMIHVASTNVPFTSESKDAIANIPEIEDEIELAIREAARELKSYLNKRRSLEKRQQKQSVLSQILPEMADKVAEVTGQERPNIDAAMGRIMNNLCIDREIDDGTVTLHVENYSDRAETPEITEIVSVEPTDVEGEGANVVDLDGEWFIQWSPSLSAGEEITLTYTVGSDAEFDITVEGVETEKLTLNA